MKTKDMVSGWKKKITGIGAENQLSNLVKEKVEEEKMSCEDGSLDDAINELKSYVNEELGKKDDYAFILKTTGFDRKNFAANKPIGELEIFCEPGNGPTMSSQYFCTIKFNGEEIVTRQQTGGNNETIVDTVKGKLEEYLDKMVEEEKLSDEEKETLVSDSSEWKKDLKEYLDKNENGTIYIEIGENGKETTDKTETETIGRWRYETRN